jgi:TonB family protein
MGIPVRDSSLLRQRPGNHPPLYPIPDRRANREGTVVLLAHIMRDGSVGQIAIQQSSGSQTIDAAAVKAYRDWKYYPGQEGWVRHPIRFQLQGVQ